VPGSLGVLVRQRRRWMNGSLFAQLLSLSQWSRLVTSTTHNPLRKLGFCVLFVYQCLSLLLSFLLLGNMYFAYAILFRVLGMSMAEASLNGDGSGAAVAVRSAFSGLVSARVTRYVSAMQDGLNMCGAARMLQHASPDGAASGPLRRPAALRFRPRAR